jgi:hypothetical protein
VVNVSGQDKTVSIDRLKPLQGCPQWSADGDCAANKDIHTRTRFGRRVRFPKRFQAGFSWTSSLTEGWCGDLVSTTSLPAKAEKCTYCK